MAVAKARTVRRAGGRGGGGGGGAASAGPWHEAFLLHFGAGENEVTGTYSVPTARSLVIETATADIGVTGGDQPFLFVSTTTRGLTAQHTIALEELPRQLDAYAATRRVQLYADAGTSVTVILTRWGSSGYPDIPKPELVTLSGRLV
jgi:hypothetical protein